MLAIEAEGATASVQPARPRGRQQHHRQAELDRPTRATPGHEGQREATRALLLSDAAVVTGIQGSAGTAKTTTVLATYADAARDQGLEVRALAPTATAADVLGRAIDAKPMTVAMMLDRRR